MIFLINPIASILQARHQHFFSSIVEERETIEMLKTKIEALQKEKCNDEKIDLQRIDVLENEVSRLRGIKNRTKESLKKYLKSLQIAQKDVIPNKKSIQINIGSDYNIKIGQTVMGVNGLLGQVARSKYVF